MLILLLWISFPEYLKAASLVLNSLSYIQDALSPNFRQRELQTITIKHIVRALQSFLIDFKDAFFQQEIKS